MHPLRWSARRCQGRGSSAGCDADPVAGSCSSIQIYRKPEAVLHWRRGVLKLASLEWQLGLAAFHVHAVMYSLSWSATWLPDTAQI